MMFHDVPIILIMMPLYALLVMACIWHGTRPANKAKARQLRPVSPDMLKDVLKGAPEAEHRSWFETERRDRAA